MSIETKKSELMSDAMLTNMDRLVSILPGSYSYPGIWIRVEFYLFFAV